MYPKALVALALVACGGSPDPGEGKDNPGTDLVTSPSGPVYDAPPTVEDIVPYVAVSDGYIYVLGDHLTATDGTFAEVVVEVVGTDAGGASVDKVLEITEGVIDRLTAHVPAGHDAEIQSGVIRITTPAGTVDGPAPVFVVEDNGFGGATLPGHGLVGTVYALKPNTASLPNLFDDPCGQPSVADNDQFSCPDTTILVPNLAIEARDFSAGFPGLGDDLVEWFAIAFDGFLGVPEAGNYQFSLCSDDGSAMWIDVGSGLQQLIDDDGQHGMACVSGNAPLEAGRIPIAVHYFQGPRYQIGLTLQWTKPDGTVEYVPQENLWLFAD